MGGNAYATSNVGAPSNHCTLQCEQRRFPTSGTAGSEVGVFIVNGTAPQWVVRFAPLALSVVHLVLEAMHVVCAYMYSTLHNVGTCGCV